METSEALYKSLGGEYILILNTKGNGKSYNES